MHAVVAEWYPKYGEDVATKVAQQIDASDALLAIVTSSSSRSAFVNQEIGYAYKAYEPHKGRKLIIPLVEDGVNTSGFLYNMEPLKFSRWNFTEAAQNIVNYLNNISRLTEAEKERQAKVLAGLLIGGLFIWSLGQQRGYE